MTSQVMPSRRPLRRRRHRDGPAPCDDAEPIAVVRACVDAVNHADGDGWLRNFPDDPRGVRDYRVVATRNGRTGRPRARSGIPAA